MSSSPGSNIGFIAALLVACGNLSSQPQSLPDASPISLPPPLTDSEKPAIPACVTDGSLRGRPVSALTECAPGYCWISGTTTDGHYGYCKSGCGHSCSSGDTIRVWVTDGIVVSPTRD